MAVGRRDAAAVPDHQVASVASGDGVTEAPADDDVIAVTGGDGVGAAVDRGGGALDEVDVAQRAIGHHVIDEAQVAQDDVVPLPRTDQVAGVAAQQQVVAVVAVNGVGSAIDRLGRGHPDHRACVHQAQGSRGLADDPVVAEDDVVTLAALQHVASGQQRIAGQHQAEVARGYGQQARHHRCIRRVLGHVEGQVEARVAVDMVVTAIAEDLVGAGATRQLVSRLAAVDGVVAGTAVDRHPLSDGAGVDHIVAGVRKVDRVAGKQTLVGSGVVAPAVLRGVAVDDQRRGSAAAAGDGDRVAAHHAVA